MLPDDYTCEGQISLEEWLTDKSSTTEEKPENEPSSEFRIGEIVVFVDGKSYYECAIQKITENGYIVHSVALGEREVQKIYKNNEEGRKKAVEQLRKNFRTFERR